MTGEAGPATAPSVASGAAVQAAAVVDGVEIAQVQERWGLGDADGTRPIDDPLDEIGATGFGLGHVADVAQEFANLTLDGARVAIQGFGAVGRHAAREAGPAGDVALALVGGRLAEEPRREAGEGQHLHCGVPFPDRFCRLDAIHARHHHVHQHDIGSNAVTESQGFLAAMRLPHHLNALDLG